MIRLCISFLLVLSLVACSSRPEPVVYNYPRHQLPAEPRYGTTAWVQPPVVIPKSMDVSGFSEHSTAPLLKPGDTPPLVGVAPKLPSAAKSRKY